MTDRDYQFEWVPDTYAARVQRRAVLYPLCGLVTTPPEIIAATQNLVRCWRARLHSLREVGWEPRVAQCQMQYVRNCPPTFAMARPHGRQCRLTYLCPFCYARWVREIWELVDNTFPNPRYEISPPQRSAEEITELDDDVPALYMSPGEETGRMNRVIDLTSGSGGDTAVAREFPYHLLLRTRTEEFAFTRGREGETHCDYAAHLLSRLGHARGVTIKQMKTLGAITLTTMEPTNGHWLVSHRELHIVPNDYVCPDVAGELLRVARPTRRELFTAVASAFRYPRQMLYGDAEMVRVVLEARVGKRLANRYGVFRIPRRRV